ncbi:glycosyltransferase family 2 protein [Chryseolinea sp. T2]|uniref:glycosyltransferase family 2 protein n=1 Tax=Chryseolinea sp. T2 TaxID=3129255 RepID=UPI0030785C97
MSKLLTIAIPTYNRAAMLDAQLSWLSTELQGHEHQCEIVVSDNCSTDRTPEIIEAWRKRFEGRITFKPRRHGQNIGGMANIVYTIEQATSTFVWSLGDDDPIQRHAVPYILEKINDHPDLSLILLNGYGKDYNTNKILTERWFDSTSDKPMRNSVSDFEVFLEKHMGGVLFISSSVYRTKLVHRAFETWPDSPRNLAAQAYWVAYCAARGSFIVTPTLFTECAMGIGFTDKDPKWTFNIVFRAIPEVYLRLMRSGYSKRFCYEMLLRNVKSFGAWQLLGGSLRRWPLYSLQGFVYYVRGLVVGACLFATKSGTAEAIERAS